MLKRLFVFIFVRSCVDGVFVFIFVQCCVDGVLMTATLHAIEPTRGALAARFGFFCSGIAVRRARECPDCVERGARSPFLGRRMF